MSKKSYDELLAEIEFWKRHADACSAGERVRKMQAEKYEAQLAVAVEALKLTSEHYKHPTKDQNWAYYLYAKHNEALDKIENLKEGK